MLFEFLITFEEGSRDGARVPGFLGELLVKAGFGGGLFGSGGSGRLDKNSWARQNWLRCRAVGKVECIALDIVHVRIYLV